MREEHGGEAEPEIVDDKLSLYVIIHVKYLCVFHN